MVNRGVREAEIVPEDNLIAAKGLARCRVVDVNKLRIGCMNARPFAPKMGRARMGNNTHVPDDHLNNFMRGGNPRARCGFGCGFHHGDKLKRGREIGKGFFQLEQRLLERSFERGKAWRISFSNEIEIELAAGDGQSRTRSNVRFIPDGAREGDGQRSKAQGEGAGKLILSLGRVANGGEGYVSGFPLPSFVPRLQWGRIA